MIRLGKLIMTGEVNDLLTEAGVITTEVSVSQLDKAYALLQSIDWVYQTQIVDETLRVSLKKNHISDLVQLLVQNEIQISAVIPRTSLEDLYLSKVGMENIL
jgi:ABC-type multidrug transport system ATPase subunit